MLDFNCALAKLYLKYDLYSSYGIEDDCNLATTLKVLSAYQWLYNNAYSCLDDCQINEINAFLKAVTKGLDEDTCDDFSISCSTMTLNDVTPPAIPTSCGTLNIIIAN